MKFKKMKIKGGYTSKNTTKNYNFPETRNFKIIIFEPLKMFQNEYVVFFIKFLQGCQKLPTIGVYCPASYNSRILYKNHMRPL